MNPTTDPSEFDVIILGAGGAGMMCAIHAGNRGRSVLLLDHAKKLGGKILISGGGRCNFTNLGAGPANYVSRNSHFCKSALSRYSPQDFIQMVRAHDIPFHEKKLGQQFCDRSAQDIVQMLQTECESTGARFLLDTRIEAITCLNGAQVENKGVIQSVSNHTNLEPSSAGAYRYQIKTSRGTFQSQSLVVATGGLSIPKIGATGFGYGLAEQFGLKLVSRDPALDGFTFADAETRSLSQLAGISIDCVISCNGKTFRENILFTHSGLSGPAALQASLHWNKGDAVHINLLPETDVFQWFLRKKKEGNRSIVRNLLCELLPSRFVELFCALHFQSELPLPQVSEKALQAFCELLHGWKITPSGTVGYGKAEVTRGGVDTDELSSKTMEAKRVPGLYFIGEVVDVTGWLGGYNFQWAWASGWAAGQVV